MNFHPIDLLRYIGTLFVAYALTLLMPFSQQINSTTFVSIITVFSFLISFLINRALDRKKVLAAAISVEVSRLRRVHHISEHIGTATWRGRLDSAINDYRHEIGKNFLNYNKHGELFRKISHPIYEFKPKNRYDEIIFGELLTTIREIALERQLIAEHIKDKLPVYSWFVVTTIAVFLIFLLLLSNNDSLIVDISISFAVASILFIMDLLRSVNRISHTEQKDFEGKYKNN